MSQLIRFQKWLQLKQYHFELSFCIYMMTPGEKFAFYSVFFLLFSLTFIAIVLYLPHHISFLVGRAWYYINGEHIDVGEVVKEMSVSVMQETATATAAAEETVSGTAEAVIKEL